MVSDNNGTKIPVINVTAPLHVNSFGFSKKNSSSLHKHIFADELLKLFFIPKPDDDDGVVVFDVELSTVQIIPSSQFLS